MTKRSTKGAPTSASRECSDDCELKLSCDGVGETLVAERKKKHKILQNFVKYRKGFQTVTVSYLFALYSISFDK